MTVALSHGGTTMYVSPAEAQRLLVGTADGVAILERPTGHEWRVVGRGLPERHISALITPAPRLVVAGVFHDSLYVSHDDGETWEQRGDGLEPANVYSLAAVERAGQLRLYAGTEPAHLFVSDDLGRRWMERPALRAVPSCPRWMFPAPPHQAHVKHIVVSPQDPTTLYACIEQGALLRSRDEGTSWEELGGVDEDVHFLIVDPRDPTRLFISGGNGCYASRDGGVTWEHRTTRAHSIGAYPDALVFRPSNPDVMFLGAARTDPPTWRKTHRAEARVCRSRDAGRTWRVLDGGLSAHLDAAVEAMTIEEYGDQTALYVGTTAGDVYASADEGDSWRRIVSGLPAISKYGHDRALAGK